MTTRRRQLWIALALAISLVMLSWAVVGIIDGITHPQSPAASSTPSIERTRTP